MSIPIWFNCDIKTQFDTEISPAGFNFVKDLFTNNKLAVENFKNLRKNMIRKLKNISNKIPFVWRDTVEQSEQFQITVLPYQIVSLNNLDVYLKSVQGGTIYNLKIANKIRLPTGLLRWCEDIDLSDSEIKNAFSFA